VLGWQRVAGISDERSLVLERPQFYTEESSFCLSCPDCRYEPDADLDADEAEAHQNIMSWLKANSQDQEDVEGAESEEE
jgi:hypothetical protein